MAQPARPTADPKRTRQRRRATKRNAETGRTGSELATSAHPPAIPRTARLSSAGLAKEHPDANSSYLKELRRLGTLADRGETIDASGMDGEEFLATYLVK